MLGAAGGALLALAVVAAVAVSMDDPGTSAAASPRFVEEAAAAGVRHAYEGGFPYIVGGGVAAFDCRI